MKKQLLSRNRQAFTLIELLTVVAIIAMLAAGAFGGYNILIEKTKKKAASVMCQTLVNACEAYFGDYNQYPAPSGGGEGSDVTTTTGPEDGMIQTLVGQDPERNRRSTDYLGSIPTASEMPGGKYRNGMHSDDSSFAIYDPWGSPYSITLDLDYDKEVQNPDGNSGTAMLRKQVLVYSWGPDQDERTWEDNVDSWRQQ